MMTMIILICMLSFAFMFFYICETQSFDSMEILSVPIIMAAAVGCVSLCM